MDNVSPVFCASDLTVCMKAVVMANLSQVRSPTGSSSVQWTLVLLFS